MKHVSETTRARHTHQHVFAVDHSILQLAFDVHVNAAFRIQLTDCRTVCTKGITEKMVEGKGNGAVLMAKAEPCGVDGRWPTLLDWYAAAVGVSGSAGSAPPRKR